MKIICILDNARNVSLLSRKTRGVIISLVVVGISFAMFVGRSGHLRTMRLMTRTEGCCQCLTLEQQLCIKESIVSVVVVSALNVVVVKIATSKVVVFVVVLLNRLLNSFCFYCIFL